MDTTFAATIDAPGERVYPIVADLQRYPDFLDIVSKVEPADDAPDGGAGAGADGGAWWVTLRAKIGPFARSKRLRMVQTAAEPGRLVRFERAEIDGRDHSAWVLEANVAPGDDGPDTSVVTMALGYGGGLWSGAIEAVLRAEVEEATERLRALATAPV
ncbi:MAG: SRPBCC family protein [Actinomycetota bacterium]